MMMNQFYAFSLLGVSAALLNLYSPSAFADHGGCPCATGYPDDATIEITEPAQRAVILWNGHTELLLLATDVALTKGKERSAVEFIPLPSAPTSIRAESAETLKRVATWAAAKQIAVPHFMNSLEKGSLRGNPSFLKINQPSELAEALAHVCPFAPQFQSGVREIASRYLHR